MNFTDGEKSYYEILEIAPDATADEIRSAYHRAKSAYKKDSVALYSLMSEEESLELLRQIETAYRVLADADRRRAYDAKIGHGGEHGQGESPFASDASEPMSKIISINRIPPMEDVGGDENILVAPSTDFTGRSDSRDRPERREAPRYEPSAAPSSAEPRTLWSGSTTRAEPSDSSGVRASSTPAPRPSEPIRVGAFRDEASAAEFVLPSTQLDGHSVSDEIARETEWRGAFLRKVREARGVPLEELSEYTKISKTYLIAIEEENYSKLPALVYLRGFIVQVSKYLKLPHEAVTKAYLARYSAWSDGDADRRRA